MNQKHFVLLSGIFLLFLSITFLLNFKGMTGNLIGTPLATVHTNLTVGESFPEISNITTSPEDFILTPNSTTRLNCISIATDYNGKGTMENISGIIYSKLTAIKTSSDDNNNHYTNTSCKITTDFGVWNEIYSNDYNLLINCSFDVGFYADPGEWACGVSVGDNTGLSSYYETNFTMQELMSLGVQDYVEFGIINSTYVSNESTVNVTNLGNVEIDLILSGYGETGGDGYSMKCNLGDEGIPIGYQKYDLTTSVSGPLSLSAFQSLYTSLTSDTTFKNYNLDYRKNDTFNDATNSTYWRIYVPRGVAGDCDGNIVFSATSS